MFLFASLLVLFILILIICSRWYEKYFNYWTHQKIPSVPGRTFSWNIRDILTFKTNFSFILKAIYDDPKYNNEAVVGIYSLQPALLVRDPDLIKSILIRDFDCFSNRFSSSDRQHDPIGYLSLFFAKYNFWKDMRTKLSPIFTSGKLKQMYPLLQKVGENLETLLHKKGDRFTCELLDIASRFTTDTVATTTFGICSNSVENPGEEVNKKARQLANFNMKRALNFLIISFLPSFNKIFKPTVFFKETNQFVTSTTEYIISEREQSGVKRNDMIDIFIKLKKEAESNGENMKEFMEGIVAQTATFMAAGIETSSTTISNILLEIAKQPEMQDRLRQEILVAFEKGNGTIPYEALNDLEYLSMIVDETLRLYPVFPLMERKYIKPDYKIDNYSLRPFYDFHIPNGMAVYISAYGLHYDPKYWTDPTKFDPERFSPERKNSINPMIYLPFGDGPRNCIGARLGHLQVKVFITYFLKNHCVRVCPATNLKTEFNAKAFILQRKGGIHLEVVKDDLYNRSVGKI